jgi:hypothetical protein
VKIGADLRWSFEKWRNGMKSLSGSLAVLSLFVCTILPAGSAAAAKQPGQVWEVLNPSGTVEIAVVKPAQRITTLEGKTIVLRWNNKHNGDKVLDRVAELLNEKVPSAKVVKLYETEKSTIMTSGSKAESERIAKLAKDAKADLVIASQAD